MLVVILGMPHGMNSFVASLDRGKHIVPIALDVCPVRMELVFSQASCQYFLALSHVLAHRNANTQRDDTQIYDDFHLS